MQSGIHASAVARRRRADCADASGQRGGSGASGHTAPTRGRGMDYPHDTLLPVRFLCNT